MNTTRPHQTGDGSYPKPQRGQQHHVTGSRLTGKSAVPLLRCSTNEQVETSLPDQFASISAFAEKKGMSLLAGVELAGVSGSIRANLDRMVDDVIRRKEAGEHIDVVVFYDQSRFGRSGSSHYQQLEDRLRLAGIELAEADMYVEDRQAQKYMRFFKAEASQMHAMRIAVDSARGQQSALERGQRSHSPKAPYGTDRMYLTHDDKPICVVRRLADGSRLRIDPAGHAEPLRFPPGAPAYRRGSIEKDTLVPGDPEHQRVVIRIFRMHYVDRFGGYKIAGILNDEGVAGPSGGDWTCKAVEAIYKNETYTGIGIANRVKNTLYCHRAPTMPESFEDPTGVRVRGFRPAEDWLEVEYPKLADYLPADLKSLAIQGQQKYQEKIASGKTRDPTRANGRRRHLLSGLMIEKTTGKPMKCVRSGQIKRVYYTLSDRDRRTTPRQDHLYHRIPSEPLHTAVLEEIEALLCGIDGLADMVKKEIRRQYNDVVGDSEARQGLVKQVSLLKKRYASQVGMLGGPDDSVVREVIAATEEQLRLAASRLDEMGCAPELSDSDIDAIAVGVLSNMSELLSTLADGDAALRRVAEHLVGSAVADLETSEVAIELVVPADLLQRRLMGLASCRGSESYRWTHLFEAIPLDCFVVEIPERCAGPCWEPWKPQGCSDCHDQPHAA